MGPWRAEVSEASISGSSNPGNADVVAQVMRTSTDLFGLASAKHCCRSPHHCLTKCLITSCRNRTARQSANWFLPSEKTSRQPRKSYLSSKFENFFEAVSLKANDFYLIFLLVFISVPNITMLLETIKNYPTTIKNHFIT